jgi:PD-(D/E)XK nuclease superfamily
LNDQETTMAINSWSFSKLGDFEKCKFLCWLKHDQKIPEPERELPPGKTEFANDRGTRIHTSCEEYVNGTADTLTPEADKHFGPQLDLLRVMHADGLVSLEGEWGMNRDWEPTDWKTAWLRLKLDAMVMHDERTATVIDFKTGRKFGNEIKHGEQLALYQLVTFLRYPKLEKVYAELWYLDQGTDNVTSLQFTRPVGLKYRSNFDRRGHKLTTCTEWPANPNKFSCQYCQYGPWNGGQCQVGIKK